MYKNVLELDIWSSFGCFNKSFSNKGGLLTYLLPPKTAVIGMIGAVLGIDYDKYVEVDDKKVYDIEKLYDIQISVQPLFDLKKIRVVFNRGKNQSKNSVQIQNIHQELLVNPKYKIFLSFPDTLSDEENEFIEKIESNITYYNLYMGRNEFLLNYRYIRKFKREDKTFSYNDSELENMKVIGFISRSNIEDISVYTDIKDINIKPYDLNISDSKPFYEYLINDYPIRRSNFTDFEYEYISFYPNYDDDKERYFEDIKLKNDDYELMLTKIGDDKWIYMI